MHSWQIRDQKQQETQDKKTLIHNQNILVVTNIVSTGNSLKSLTQSISQYLPRKIKTVAAFQMHSPEDQEEYK